MSDRVQDYVDLVEGTLQNALDHIGELEELLKQWREVHSRIGNFARQLFDEPDCGAAAVEDLAGQILQEVRDLEA